MIFNIWRWIQMWLLPYGILVKLYRRNKALPANIRTWEGNNYKAILITKDYGILFSADKYIENRGKYLMEQKRIIEEQNTEVLNELHDLNVLAREEIYQIDKTAREEILKKDNNGGV